MFSFSVFVETRPGVEVSEACRDAVNLAKLIQSDVKFRFNGTEVCATPKSDPQMLVVDWHNAFHGRKVGEA